MKLFLKYEPHHHGKVWAWSGAKPEEGLPGIHTTVNRTPYPMQAAFVSDFDIAMRKGYERGVKHIGGAGGAHDCVYAVYDLDTLSMDYAIVYPSASVRESYPNVRRLVSLTNTCESALHPFDECLHIAQLAQQGKLRGGFGLDPRPLRRR